MPTINDIAKEAGVSHGTVSNVLNKTGKVSVEKIQLVEQAIKKLGYTPNVQAQRLRQGKPNTIAVILPSLKETKYAEFFTAIQLNLPKGQNSLLVYQTEDIPAEEEAILDDLRTSGLAVLITFSCLSKSCLEKYRSLPCPVIYIDRKPKDLLTNEWFLSFDAAQIADLAAAYCSKQRWRSVAYFGAKTHGESSDRVLQQLMAKLPEQSLSLKAATATYKLALGQAVEFAHSCTQYDAVITQSAISTDALFEAFRLLHLKQTPPIIVIGAYAARAAANTALLQLDYGFLGIRAVKLLPKITDSKGSPSHEVLFEPKGFPRSALDTKPFQDEELTMLTLENPSTHALKNLLPEFEHESGIKVKLISVTYEDLQAQLKLIGPQFTYDMIRIDVAQLDEVGQKIYRPFDEISIEANDLPPRLIKNGHSNYSVLGNRIYTLPLDPSVQIFLYREDLFQDATLCRAYYERFHENLVVPSTYEQYLHIAEFFTRSYNPNSPTEYGTTMTCGSAIVAASDFLPFYLSKAEKLYDQNGKIDLNDSNMKEALQQYYALREFSCRQNWWSDSIAQFAEGKTAMTVVYSNYAAALINSKNSVVVGKVGAAVIPGKKPLLGGGVVGISKYSQKTEACKQFFDWYYSTEVASLLVRLGGTSPIVDAYEDFQNYSTFPWMNTSKKSFGLGQRGIHDGSLKGFSLQRYEFAIGTVVRNVVQGLMTIDSAGAMAQTLYDTTPSQG